MCIPLRINSPRCVVHGLNQQAYTRIPGAGCPWWCAQVKGFPTKQQAKDWAAREEHQILNADLIAADMTFGALMDRYARERSGAKRGARWEIIRLEKLGRDKIAKIKLGALKASDFADWRDRRTSEVARGSVIREMQLMTSVLSVARKEWGLIGENPMRDVRKPTKPPPRDRLPGGDEIERLRHTAGSDLTKATARAFHAFCLRWKRRCGLERFAIYSKLT